MGANGSRDIHGYRIVGSLGTGSFSDVYKATELSTKDTVALKRIKEEALDVLDSVSIEIKSLQIAVHKNVVKYINSFTDENTLYIVLEYCKFGPIDSFIKSKEPDEEKRMANKVFKSEDTKKKIEILYMETMAGTYAYMAPEVPTGRYNAQADIFSMGILFFGILNDELKEKVERE
ncbi:calcium-dependent protein kinase 16-like [Anneissia japonica]|uniref:calcium-dependent protein kinase 16-like n=1 Tax=Anneissia japonica TaxID=1529436 RepID=UPI0014255512|nr:calcium-dependent protein kinase 16-like [Anneissia japonica]